jgi:GNAT superfamily N-acetyltransferase
LERDPDHPERAEIAFAIADAMQHNGLGTILLGQLIEAADQAGVAVLSAEVLPQNQHMLHVFRDSGIPVTTRTLPGVVLVELPTSRSPAALNLERREPPRTRASRAGMQAV